MRTFLQTLLLVIAVAQGMGCASNPSTALTTRGYAQLLNDRIGEDDRDLIRDWGIPDGRFSLEDDVYILRYEQAGATTTSATYQPTWPYAGRGAYESEAVTETSRCVTEFEVERGEVVRWRIEGTCYFRERAWLGLDLVEVDAPELEALGLPRRRYGLQVRSVHPRGPGQRAGLRKGDILLTLGARNAVAQNLRLMVDLHSPGDWMNVEVWRAETPGIRLQRLVFGSAP